MKVNFMLRTTGCSFHQNCKSQPYQNPERLGWWLPLTALDNPSVKISGKPVRYVAHAFIDKEK